MGIIAGVVLEDFVAQAGAVDVDVDLGCGDALVTQHLLDGAQVGTALEQVGGETVAQGVGADDLAHSGQFTQLLDDMENHLTRQHRAAAVQEQDVLAAALGNLTGTRLFQIQVDLLNGDGRDGHSALLVTLALDDDIMLVKIELGQLERHQLAHAQAAAVERLDDGAVALPLGLGHVDGSDHRVDFGDGEHLGQVTADFGCEQQFRRVGIHEMLLAQELVEAFHAADDARLGPWLDAHVLQGADEAFQVVGRGMFDAHAGIGKVADEFVHVVTVGDGGILAHAFLQRQMSQELTFHVRYVGNVAQELLVLSP